ncbi:MAG: radical SAM family heme chaperone HemW [Bacteroidales bacterium]|nr:radical SAM family heme chaperone HemW [Bacteroidales bacterium]
MAGIYIHIPFCRSKCIYCNFYSIAVKNQNVLERYKNDFLNALYKEIQLRKNYLDNENIKTIYFGGGTPSILSAKEIESIIIKIKKYHQVDDDAEITLEANPDTLSYEKLKAYKNIGINRLSIGIQSFNDKDLKYLHRIHDSKKAIQAIENAKKADFDNFSIDLIYGIPTLNNKSWEYNLQKTFDFQIPHISAYSLTVEPQTPLSHLIKSKKILSVDDAQSIEHFNILSKMMMQNNYQHYEISNFCKKDFYSKHNTNYWIGEKYLGLGPSAHSYNKISRQWNLNNIKKYIENINDKKPFSQEEKLTLTQKYNEYILVSLRTMWGIDLNFIKNNFDEKFLRDIKLQIQKHLKDDYLKIENNHIFLTEKGKLFTDAITSDLFVVE